VIGANISTTISSNKTIRLRRAKSWKEVVGVPMVGEGLKDEENRLTEGAPLVGQKHR